MGLLDRLRPTTAPDPMVEVLQESVADLSLRLEDRGWRQVGDTDDALSREAYNVAARDGRALAVAHPLVRRGLSLRTAYVHGQGGPQITVDPDSDVDDKVAEVVTAWWSSRENQASLTGAEARARLERSLSTDGNVFLAAFTDPTAGRVTVRSIPLEQIDAIHANPDDRMQVWFYQRTYTRKTDPFATSESTVTVLHPDLAYAPASKPATMNGMRVLWDQPIRHVKVNDLDGWQYGLGDTFSIAPWARAYRDFLSDWAKLMRSLSQFAWRATADGKRAARARQALARIPAGTDGGAGASMVLGTGENLEAIPKSGATIDADSGRPILAMIAAGLDIPVTMLSTDPGITGARSTAETLDEPMYLAMAARRDVWAAVYVDFAEYAIEAAVRAPSGPLTGQIVRDAWTATDAAVVNGGTPVVHVDWPDLSTASTEEAVNAIAKADSTGKLPPATIARLLLTALGVDDIDGVMEELTDEDGQWRDPYAQLGQGLVNAFNAGQDPAQALSQYGRFGTDTAAAEAKVRP